MAVPWGGKPMKQQWEVIEQQARDASTLKDAMRLLRHAELSRRTTMIAGDWLVPLNENSRSRR
jgi:hypothetical protein